MDLINKQPVIYKDTRRLETVQRCLSKYPPLVTAREIKTLRTKIASAQRGEVFIVQGGPCAESFDEFSTRNVMNTMYTLIECGVVVSYNTKKKVVQIGRMAGQYAKPRSNLYDGDVSAYRGDIINTETDREPDPFRMMTAYFQSCSTNNFCSSLVRDDYYDMKTLKEWNMIKSDKYDRTIEDIIKGVHFAGGKCSNEQFFNSHECMLLEYETCFKRIDSKTDNPYLTSTHMPWIGERTRFVNSVHVDFLKNVENPIGIKVGPTTSPEEISELIRILNPKEEDGKIVLIIRMGSDIYNKLPDLCECLKDEKLTWISDPMHANTVNIGNVKTRIYDDIVLEFKRFVKICRENDVIPAGIHLEMSGDNVTECVDSNTRVEEYLKIKYETKCDPRLNMEQVLNMSFDISNILNANA